MAARGNHSMFFNVSVYVFCHPRPASRPPIGKESHGRKQKWTTSLAEVAAPVPDSARYLPRMGKLWGTRPTQKLNSGQKKITRLRVYGLRLQSVAALLVRWSFKNLQKKDRKGVCLMQEAGTQRVTSLCTKSLQKTLAEFLLLWALCFHHLTDQYGVTELKWGKLQRLKPTKLILVLEDSGTIHKGLRFPPRSVSLPQKLKARQQCDPELCVQQQSLIYSTGITTVLIGEWTTLIRSKKLLKGSGFPFDIVVSQRQLACRT